MIKKTVVAGSFYPQDKNVLNNMLEVFFNKSKEKSIIEYKKIFALIVPHAGYIYSGQTAANAYVHILDQGFKNAIIIAPSHYSGNCDFSIGSFEKYETPLGMLSSNQDVINYLQSKDGFGWSEYAENREHSLEVQLPFLYYINPEIKIIPVIFCRQTYENAIRLSEYISEIVNDDTLIVISTDLSHFHHAKVAQDLDFTLIKHIENNDIEQFYFDLINGKIEACGFGGVIALMNLINKYSGCSVNHLKYTHSGLITGDNSQVVGYCSGVYYK